MSEENNSFNGLNGRAVATSGAVFTQGDALVCFNGLNGRAVATAV